MISISLYLLQRVSPLPVSRELPRDDLHQLELPQIEFASVKWGMHKESVHCHVVDSLAHVNESP